MLTFKNFICRVLVKLSSSMSLLPKILKSPLHNDCICLFLVQLHVVAAHAESRAHRHLRCLHTFSKVSTGTLQRK